jgi:hypothetical protein
MQEATNADANTASSIITGKVPMLQVPLPASHAAEQAYPEAIEGHIVAYYYAALTNLFCQVGLPSAGETENNDVATAIIDSSYNDFHMLDSWLAALEPNEIQGSPSAGLYYQVRDLWSHRVKDWPTVSKRNQKTG